MAIGDKTCLFVDAMFYFCALRNYQSRNIGEVFFFVTEAQPTNRRINGIRHTNFYLLKPTGHVMHQQFNIQQLYVVPTLYLCVLYLSENKQRLVPLTA